MTAILEELNWDKIHASLIDKMAALKTDLHKELYEQMKSNLHKEVVSPIYNIWTIIPWMNNTCSFYQIMQRSDWLPDQARSRLGAV